MPRLVPPVVPAGRMRAGPQPTLPARPHLEARPWRPTDANDLLHAFADPEIRRWHMRELDTEREALDWMMSWTERWTAETDAGWAVADRETDELRGQVALRFVNLEFGYGHVTYWTRPEFRGSGIAASAADAVGRWALEDLGLHRLEIHHSTANASSCRVAEKAGFEFEGVMRSALLHEDGWHDMHVHARIRHG
ncbi:MAG: GNAT family N-acetyltransferase [Actinomycetota bacterium]